MILEKLVLQNFRSYRQEKFTFHEEVTVIIGPNTAGKTNIVEAIVLLSSGKSFRTDKDAQMIRFGQDVGRVQGLVKISNIQNEEEKKLEVTLVNGAATGGRFVKRYLINGVAKRRIDFTGLLPIVLFSPEELDIIAGSPSLRRNFLDNTLEQTDRHYRLSRSTYDKALRQRNALLHLVREEIRFHSDHGREKYAEQFSYWDRLLIEHGAYIAKQRGLFLDAINAEKKDIFPFQIVYDKSLMSKERLQQYEDAEIAAGITLVGPQRDDFFLLMRNGFPEEKNIAHFGSRGQQRLAVLQLKLLETLYIEGKMQTKAVLVLDDIFSELDAGHIKLVLENVSEQQVIMTTTHEEFIDKKLLRECSIINLASNKV